MVGRDAFGEGVMDVMSDRAVMDGSRLSADREPL